MEPVKKHLTHIFFCDYCARQEEPLLMSVDLFTRSSKKNCFYKRHCNRLSFAEQSLASARKLLDLMRADKLRKKV